MPAFFAYLVALTFLLGGGYGALHWLAAPEPLNIAVKAKKTKLPFYEARSEEMSKKPESSSEASPAAASFSSAEAENVAPSPVGRQELHETASALATVDRSMRRESPEPPPDQQARSAKLDAPSDEPKRTGEKAGGAKEVPTASAPRPRNIVRTRPRQSVHRAEKRKLVLMTMRTIQFPDGRRVTRLIPFRGGERALAFGPDD